MGTFASIGISLPSSAQIVPDSTLANPSIVTPNNNTFTIDGGTTAGSNLFHSFQDFSVPIGSEAFFNNAASIDNIISRVTGGNISTIDGLLRTNSAANLFLLNPNGVVFGPDASLDVGGSLVISTADALEFADGSFFSASDPQANSLLSVTVPVGLNFAGNSGSIEIIGIGDPISNANEAFPFARSPNSSDLRGASGETLAFVGSGVSLQGGVVTAPSGRVELGSVEEGTVAIAPDSRGFALDYSQVGNFQDLQLSETALADASGTAGGAIALQGRQVQIAGGSFLLVQNQGSQPAGEIGITASEFVEIVAGEMSPSVIASETISAGSASDIIVVSPQFVLRDGGKIFLRSYDSGTGGSILVEASEEVLLLGQLVPFDFTVISPQVFGTGDAGDVTISTQRFVATNGALASSTTFGSGNGGNLTLNAEIVELRGGIPISGEQSGLGATSFGSGDAGTLTINAERLRVLDGALVAVSTLTDGTGGNVIINAETVELRGALQTTGLTLASEISSGAVLRDAAFREAFGLPPFPTGDSGNVTIAAERLAVADGGQISVQNEGTGNAGNLQVSAERILLRNGADLTAATFEGNGGNLIVQAEAVRVRNDSSITADAGGAGIGGNITIDSEFLSLREGRIQASTTSGNGSNITLNGENILMRRNSLISTEAGGTGNGGDIDINTETLVGLFNSDIVANAFQGNGGNITIVAEGVIGLQPRPFRTPFSDITASSQFGLDGDIEITTPDVNSDDIFESLSGDTIDAGDTVAYCAGLTAADVAFTGRGGIPENPRLLLEHPIALEDLGSDEPLPEEQTSNSRTEEISPPLVEAGGWIEGRNGVQLVTMPRIADTDAWMRQATCEDANAVSQR